MNPEIIISISFIVIVIIESIILLKSFFNKNATNEKEFFNLLFRFISNSFIYISSLLILIATLTNINILTIEQFNDLNSITLGQTAIVMILFTNIITIISILFGGINKLKNRKQNNKTTKKIINQEKAKKVT
ncbi:hypothetical protein MWH25_12685 [Natroniella acetigena]|uniref:hypothetical protein n=1 Tax=Natroniella acetigena TaxID=52004 RepID=UPI00200A2FB9|nr:hypothetical protein [Natroniella acetigena]MCK8828580.1 hypothetical protein [Natroniella acetigena]